MFVLWKANLNYSSFYILSLYFGVSLLHANACWRLMKRIVWLYVKTVAVDCIYRNSILEVVNYKSIQNQIYEIWIKLAKTYPIIFLFKIESSICNKCRINHSVSKFPSMSCKSFFKNLQQVKNCNGSIVVIITRFFRDENTSFFFRREQYVRLCARLTTFEIRGSGVLLWKILGGTRLTIYGRRFAVTLCRCTEVGAQWEPTIRKENESKVCKADYCYAIARWYCKALAYSYFLLFILSPLAILLFKL